MSNLNPSCIGLELELGFDKIVLAHNIDLIKYPITIFKKNQFNKISISYFLKESIQRAKWRQHS